MTTRDFKPALSAQRMMPDVDVQAARRPSGQKAKAGPSRFKGRDWTNQEVDPDNETGPSVDAPDFIAHHGPLPRNSLADQCATLPPP